MNLATQILKREAIVTMSILAATVLLVFPLTYWVGVKTFGSYRDDAGMMSFIGSIFSDLAAGKAAMWFFLISPLLVISCARLAVKAWKKLR